MNWKFWKRPWNLEKYYKEVEFPYIPIIVNGVPTAYNKTSYSIYSAIMGCFEQEIIEIINKNIR